MSKPKVIQNGTTVTLLGATVQGVETCNSVSPVVPISAITCLVCGESVELSEAEMNRLQCHLPIQPKICKKCKDAIMEVRKRREEAEQLW